MSLRLQVTTATSRPTAIGATNAAPRSARARRACPMPAAYTRSCPVPVATSTVLLATVGIALSWPPSERVQSRRSLQLLRHRERIEPRRLAGVALRGREEEPLRRGIPGGRAVERGREGQQRAAARGRPRASSAARRRARRPCPRRRRAGCSPSGEKTIGVEPKPKSPFDGMPAAWLAATSDERGAQLDDRLGVILRLVGAGRDVGVRAGRPDVAVGRHRDAAPAPDAAAAGLAAGRADDGPGVVDRARLGRHGEHAAAVGPAVAVRGDAEVDVPVAERDAPPTRARGTDRRAASPASRCAPRRCVRRAPTACRSRPRRRSRPTGS